MHHAEVTSNAQGLIDVHEIRDRLASILDLELIADGENAGVELKPDDVRPETLAEEVMALRNPIGGQVLPGAEDDEAASRVKRDDLEPRVSAKAFARYGCPPMSALCQAPSLPSNASTSKPIVTACGHQSGHLANPVGATYTRARRFSAKSAGCPLALKCGSDSANSSTRSLTLPPSGTVTTDPDPS